MTNISLLNNIYRHTQQGQPDECWPWYGALHSSGVPVVSDNRKNHLAQRVLYKLKIGNVPEYHYIATSCGNRICMNPAHLIAVSNTETCRRGENHPRTRLTAELVRKIRQQTEQGVTQRELTILYNIPRSTINDIVTGKSWRKTSK